MSILSTDFLIEQSPSIIAPKGSKDAHIQDNADLSVTDSLLNNSNPQNHHLTPQGLKFSELLSNVQQNGVEPVIQEGNNLPLISLDPTSLLPEISNQIVPGEVQPIITNENLKVEKLVQIEIISLDIEQSAGVETLAKTVSTRPQPNIESGISFDNTGTKQDSRLIGFTIDRHYGSDIFGQTPVMESDDASTSSIGVISEIGNNIPIAISGTSVEEGLDSPISQPPINIRQVPITLRPATGLSNDKSNNLASLEPIKHSLVAVNTDLDKKLEIESLPVGSLTKTKITSQFVASIESREQILASDKITDIKSPVEKKPLLVDKFELNPNKKLTAQLIKNLTSNIESNGVYGKTTQPLGNPLIISQDVSQPLITQNINLQSLTGQPVLQQNIASVQVEQNANGLLQQGLSLRGDFSPNLANRIQWIYSQALTSAEILMDPPELGPLSVKLQSHRGETHILFQVSNPQTKEMIEDSLSKLKEMLEQQGIQLGETLVEHREANSDEKEGSAKSHSLAFAEPEDPLHNDSTVKTIGLLDTYA